MVTAVAVGATRIVLAAPLFSVVVPSLLFRKPVKYWGRLKERLPAPSLVMPVPRT